MQQSDLDRLNHYRKRLNEKISTYELILDHYIRFPKTRKDSDAVGATPNVIVNYINSNHTKLKILSAIECGLPISSDQLDIILGGIGREYKKTIMRVLAPIKEELPLSNSAPAENNESESVPHPAVAIAAEPHVGCFSFMGDLKLQLIHVLNRTPTH